MPNYSTTIPALQKVHSQYLQLVNHGWNPRLLRPTFHPVWKLFAATLVTFLTFQAKWKAYWEWDSCICAWLLLITTKYMLTTIRGRQIRTSCTLAAKTVAMYSNLWLRVWWKLKREREMISNKLVNSSASMMLWALFMYGWQMVCKVCMNRTAAPVAVK